MTGGRRYACRGIVRGRATGTVLRSSDGICFYLVEPTSGVMTEKGHPINGRSVAGSVLVFPTGKGSSVVQLDGLYQLVKHGVGPKAMVVDSPDTVLVACAVIMEIGRSPWTGTRDGSSSSEPPRPT
jgi:hypothetical protein